MLFGIIPSGSKADTHVLNTDPWHFFLLQDCDHGLSNENVRLTNCEAISPLKPSSDPCTRVVTWEMFWTLPKKRLFGENRRTTGRLTWTRFRLLAVDWVVVLVVLTWLILLPYIQNSSADMCFISTFHCCKRTSGWSRLIKLCYSFTSFHTLVHWAHTKHSVEVAR